MEMTICPKCQKTVENRDYARSGPTLMGATDPRIKCKKCGYLGLPIVLSDEGDGQEI
jgi:C4-type Zn-finger protein